MDVLLPVFQLLYFVTHFLYSLAQSVVSTWNLLLAILLRSNGSIRSSGSDGHGKGLAKTPRHLGLVLGLPRPSVPALAALVGVAAEYGVEFVSVYDIVGDVKLHKSSVLRELETVSGLNYRFVEHSGEVEERREDFGGKERRREDFGETERRREDFGETERESGRELHEEAEIFKKNLQNSGMKTENENLEGSPTPSCPDRRPLVTIKFLGVEAGRHVLATAALSHARMLQVASAAESASFTRPGLRRRRKDCSGMFPEGSEHFPGESESFTKESGIFAENDEIFHKSSENFHENDENFPKRPEKVLKNHESFPESSQNFPKFSEIFPKSAENFPSSEKIAENPHNSHKCSLEAQKIGLDPQKTSIGLEENSLDPEIIPLHPQKTSLGLQTPSLGLPTSRDISEAVSLGLPDPEVLVTLGLNSSLGYPPWKLRAAEIHFLDLSECSGGLGKVLEAYAGCEQRWGR